MGGWQINIDSIGVYGNFCMKRAIVAMLGLGSNAAEDAVYPLLLADADGNAVSGDNDYVMHFDADKRPPVRRVLGGDGRTTRTGIRLPMGSTGSRWGSMTHSATTATARLTSTSRTSTPVQDKQANWLPAPRAPFGICMRLYLPTARVLHGEWAPPPLRKR